MFRKPFKVKSFVTLKSSDRKKLTGNVKTSFSLSDDIIFSLFPSKEHISCHRIITVNKEQVSVYGCQNKPLFFESDGILFPTVYSLWICATIIPCITTHEPLIEKLINGADLMIPGVTINSCPQKFKDLNERTVVYICTLNNVSAVAVGITTVSTTVMRPGNKGKAVHIYHTINDELCKLFEIKESVPELGPFLPELPLINKDLEKEIVSERDQVVIQQDVEPITEMFDNATTLSLHEPSEEISRSRILMGAGDIGDQMKDDENNLKQTMDELILFCFLTALKTTASKVQLPVLTNIFYKNHILEAVPKDSFLDIKKTKYKKLSNFLSEMSEKGLISLQTDRGVQAIISINYSHETIKNFKIENKNELGEKKMPSKFEVEEKYVINGSVDVIFSKCNYRKGDHLSDQELRKCVTSYIKSRDLVDPNRDQFVTMDDTLRAILGIKEYCITWKTLFSAVIKKMSRSYFIKTPYSGIISGKGKLPSIKLSTVSKASNKKVTVVDNLDFYGININEFSKQCQHGVAASSTINTLPSKAVQFQIQGNQKIFITSLLTEKYGIPKRFIEGAEEQKKKDALPKKISSK